jgi:S-formylglutathione hydrolase FrmB
MGHYNNWTDKTRVAAVSSSLGMITVTPEGEDGWYTDSASKASDKYESYIIQELIPEIDKKFRTIPNRPNRAIAGLSMGGFGAVKFGLKYPELFSLAGSFSGAIGGATITEKEFPGAIGRTINSIFGPVGSPTRASNDPFSIIRTATPDKISKLPFIYLDCGTEDFLFRNNRDFVALLVEKKVPHEYRQLPG